jgi:hypothetical protein
LKDDVTNFIKSHSLVADSVEGNLIFYTDKQVSKITVDTIKASDSTRNNILYLATGKESTGKKRSVLLLIILNLLTFAIADGVVLKIVDLLNNGVWSQVSQWKVCEEHIDDIKAKQVFFVFDYLRQKPK